MGGMEDYYIAQFFCWREIILLNLEIDIETFSSVNLAKAGVYRYAESPDFEVLLFGYSVDGGEVKVGDLVKGEKIPEEVMSALEDEAVTKWAFNAQFERICISRMLGYEAGTYLVPASWKCSMVWSAYMGLPLSLEGVGAVLGLLVPKFTVIGLLGKAEINRRERFDTREAITKDQMRKFLKFVHDDNVYCKYYEVFYILFHTGLRISEFCGLTIKDIDLKNRIINIDHQLQKKSKIGYYIEETKTESGTRVLPMTADVEECFKKIIANRKPPKVEPMVDGYTGFLYFDKDGSITYALHWEHYFKHIVDKYNSIYKVQMPKVTPHVCRHTYCSNMAKSGMNPKTLQYLMGHSDISVTLNVYTHVNFDDAKAEIARLKVM